jgi:hypothetical protein
MVVFPTQESQTLDAKQGRRYFTYRQHQDLTIEFFSLLPLIMRPMLLK